MTRDFFITKNRLSLIFIFLAIIIIVSSCSSDGACIIPSPTGRDDWAHCFDGWTKQECVDQGEAIGTDTDFSSRSCNANGFTKQCPGEQPAWRMASYSCD